MDGLAAHDAAQHTRAGVDIYAHARQDGGIYAADGGYGEEAVI